MLALTDSYEGMPARLYRAPEEIRRDIRRITEKIKEADEMLSVRSILLDLVSECLVSDPHKWIPELRETALLADESLRAMKRLCESLGYLEEELEDTLCALK